MFCFDDNLNIICAKKKTLLLRYSYNRYIICVFLVTADVIHVGSFISLAYSLACDALSVFFIS